MSLLQQWGLAARAASAGIISAPQRYASFVIAMIIPVTVTTTIATCVQIQVGDTPATVPPSGPARTRKAPKG
jgi:hypothetical protein